MIPYKLVYSCVSVDVQVLYVTIGELGIKPVQHIMCNRCELIVNYYSQSNINFALYIKKF